MSTPSARQGTPRRSAGPWQAVRRHPFLVLLFLAVLAAAVAIGAATAYVFHVMPSAPGIGDVRRIRAEHPSVVLTADGQPLAELKRSNRQWVPLADIAPSVIDALIATEDRRFREHGGLDLRRTAAAAWHSLTGKLQGGSTLTQQLARNLYPEEIGRAPSIERKVKEAITALRIESVYSKDEILETYLNTVPFLYNAYGIEMAARTYFDKNARELDVLESATLVGMLKGTSYYNPVLNPERARQRRNVVLAQMARNGKLPSDELARLREQPLKLDFERQQDQPGPAPHFVQQLRRWLIDWADQNGWDIYADGLVVRTSIDSRVQALAAQAVARHADRLQETADAHWNARDFGGNRALSDALVRETAEFQSLRSSGVAEDEALARLRRDVVFMQTLRRGKARLQAGFVAMEPTTGLVRAWVGSRGFEEDQFDHVQQARRQPGSTFKPFVYGAAFAQGVRPGDLLVDEVLEFRVAGGQVWRPTDAGAPSGLPMTLRDGLALSRNTITAQLTHHVGPERVAELATAMGVRDSRLEPVLSLGLGTSPVSLKEMVSAYGTIANAGRYVAPVAVLRIEDREGRVLQEFRPRGGEQVLDETAALLLLDALRGAIDQGTGTAIRTRHGIRGDVAGKTGTTQDNTDGWFILMHPQLVAGAWVGFNDSRLTMADTWGQGSRSALPMVGDFFQQALRAGMIDAKARFAPPPPEPTAPAGPEWMGGVFPGATAPAGDAVVVSPPPAQPVDTIPGPSTGPQGTAPWPGYGGVPSRPAEPWQGSRPERAIVVAPPRSGSISGGSERHVEPVIVVAPPRDERTAATGTPPARPPAVVVLPPQPAVVAPSPGWSVPRDGGGSRMPSATGSPYAHP